MARKLNIPLPSLGLVVDRPAEFVDQRAAFNIKNMEFNRSIIRKRLGTLSLGATMSERIQRYFELQVGGDTRLFRVGTTAVQVLNKTTSVWSSVATAALTGTASDQISYAFPLLSGAKIAVYTNGVNVIKKCSLTGNDAALGGSPPTAKFVIDYAGYLLLGYVTDGGTTYYSRVQWCDTGAPETWTGGNSGSKDLMDDPDDITGFGLFGGFVTVHKANAIYLGQLVTTSAVFRFDRKSTGVGAASEATIKNLPTGEQIFLAYDGIHLFNGVTAPLIDSPIQDELREDMNPLYISKSQAIFVRELDEYWVCVPIGSDTEPQSVYKYNWRTRQLYKDYRTNLVSMGIYLNTNADTWADRANSWDSDTTLWSSVTNLSLNPIVILGDSTGISTKRSASASNNDNGTAVEGTWDTKDFTAEDLGLPDMDRIMRWKGLEIWAKGNALSLYYSTDEGVSWTLVTTFTLSSAYPTDDSPLNAYFDVFSSRIRFRFTNSTAGESFTLKKYQIEASQREARK